MTEEMAEPVISAPKRGDGQIRRRVSIQERSVDRMLLRDLALARGEPPDRGGFLPAATLTKLVALRFSLMSRELMMKSFKP